MINNVFALLPIFTGSVIICFASHIKLIDEQDIWVCSFVQGVALTAALILIVHGFKGLDL